MRSQSKRPLTKMNITTGRVKNSRRHPGKSQSPTVWNSRNLNMVGSRTLKNRRGSMTNEERIKAQSKAEEIRQLLIENAKKKAEEHFKRIKNEKKKIKNEQQAENILYKKLREGNNLYKRLNKLREGNIRRPMLVSFHPMKKSREWKWWPFR